jgi:hypothetical protein
MAYRSMLWRYFFSSWKFRVYSIIIR